MTANQKVSPTMMWLKQLTTSTFANLNKEIDRVDFFRRNKKALGLLLLVYFSVMAAGYYYYNSTAQKKLNDNINQGALAAERLADQSGSPLLEEQVLELNRIVTEFAKDKSIIFAAVLNHENRIVAHSEPEKLNQAYEPLTGRSRLASIGEVLIQTGQLPDGLQAVTFFRNITFSGVTIGSAVYAVTSEHIFGLLSRYRLYKILFVTIGSFLFLGMVLFINISNKKSQPPPMPVSADGAQIGPYRLREMIAQGGMAALYLADYIREDGFKRTVAVKKVLPHLAENQDFINMFIREARLAALLQHPNIVQIFDFGKIQNTYFIAMEFINGMTLGQIMAHLQKGLPVNMGVFLILQVCLGLDYSHKRKDDDSGQPLGIVHRDISPQNILISYQGEVKLSDFGISKANTEPSLTQAGVIKGKLAYLSPEQALGQPVDQQADVYSLGLVFYECLSGSRIYQFDSDIEAIRIIPEMEIQPLKLVREEIPDALNDIVMKCLAKDKKLRYFDAKSVYDDLTKLKTKLQIAYDTSDLSNFMRMTFDHE